jgi:hypothetical protein
VNTFEQANNPNTQPKVLEVLANDDYYWVRYLVADNPNTPPKSLELLVTDVEYCVLRHVSRNPNTPYRTKKYLKIQEHLMTLL